MSDHFPLIINPITTTIEELALGDNLDLSGSGIANANTINVATLQFADGTSQNTAGGGGAGSFLITSNIIMFTAGSGLAFDVSYANTDYPGGVWTLYQVPPITPLYWKYNTSNTDPSLVATDSHLDVSFVVNPGSTNNGIGVWTSGNTDFTWIALPSDITVPFFKFDQPPFFGIQLVANTDYFIVPDVANIHGTPYTGYVFTTFDPTVGVQFIYTASA